MPVCRKAATVPEVRRNDEEHRYELWDDGQMVGKEVFHDRGPRRLFVHTEVDDAHQGKGYASTLVRGALDDTREQGRPVVPLCTYVSGWIERHDEYADVVDHKAVGFLDT